MTNQEPKKPQGNEADAGRHDGGDPSEAPESGTLRDDPVPPSPQQGDRSGDKREPTPA
jgi:hypothetical protein